MAGKSGETDFVPAISFSGACSTIFTEKGCLAGSESSVLGHLWAEKMHRVFAILERASGHLWDASLPSSLLTDRPFVITS
jgi:hypothetical protein